MARRFLRRVPSLAALMVSAALACGLAWATRTQADALRPGDSVWAPERAPDGPVLVVVSLPAQQAWVYRNGVRIGTSPVSTGRPGHETPAGIYTILQKRREHYSNLYDNAPMPFMQRLTWDGIALHAGHLPGYPASHGCIRLPLDFAERLFGITGLQTTVVVTDAPPTVPPIVAGPFALAGTGGYASVDGVPLEATWTPEAAPAGPLTLVLGTRDGLMLVLRDGVEIGRAKVSVDPALASGTHVYALLEGRRDTPGLLLPDRPALPWSALATTGAGGPVPDLRQAVADGRLAIPPDFARAVYDALVPGTTLILTEEPLP